MEDKPFLEPVQSAVKMFRIGGGSAVVKAKATPKGKSKNKAGKTTVKAKKSKRKGKRD